MLKTKIGFLPSNWESWDGGGWGGKMRDRCVAVLKDIPGMELVVPSKELTGDGCVRDVEQAKKTLAYFKKEEIKGLFIGNMTFGMEVAVSTILDGLPKDMPILHFCTRSGPIVKGVRSSDNWCGQFMTASAIKRRDFKFVHIHTCNPEDDYFKENIEAFSRAVCAIDRFKGARFGQLGARPQLFESENWSEQALQKHFRQMVIPMDLDMVLTKIENIEDNDPEVQKVITEITQDVDLSEHTDRDLIMLAKCEVGYRRIAEELEADALAINCWTRIEERLGVAPCSVLGRLNDKGIPAACEVDVYGAVTMWALYTAGLGLVAPHFIDWTDLHPDIPNVWLAWHCGNAPRSILAKKCKPRLDKNIQLLQWCPNCFGALEMRLKEGPVTCARLVEYDGEFTFFFGTGEIIDVPPFSRGAYGWVKVNDVFDWEDKMIENGVIHHGVLIHDPKVADALVMFCKFLGIKSVRGV